MRILIVAPRASNNDKPVFNYMFPVGLAYIAAAAKAAGHEVKCLNTYHGPGSIAQQLQACRDSGLVFDVACTGGLSGEYGQVKAVVDAVRNLKLAPVMILGGGLITSEPELMFESLKPDYEVLGEGEETICELLAVLARGGDLATVLGIGYRRVDGTLAISGPRPSIIALDAVPWPDYDAFGFEDYLDNMKPSDSDSYDLFDNPRVYPIITSRSCPHRCTFCFHPLGNKYRQRTIDSVMLELEDRVARYRINAISIYDELFSQDPARVNEFCARITALRERTPWPLMWGCQMRVDRLNDAMLATMKQAGCYVVSYGFESYSTDVLNSMRKHITPVQIDQAIKLTIKHQIGIQANFIFGDRAETHATARTTLAYWKAHPEAGILLGFINPYPGTALYAYCIEKGIIQDRLDFIKNHISEFFNMTQAFSEREFSELRFNVFVEQMRQVSSVQPSALHRQADGLFRLTVTCPRCRQTINYANYGIRNPWMFSIRCYCRNCRCRMFVASRMWKAMARSVAVLNAILPAAVKTALLDGASRLWRQFAGRPAIRRGGTSANAREEPASHV